MKKNIILSLAVFILFSMFISSNSVFAQRGNTEYAPGFKTKGNLIEYLRENQVPNNKQSILINKIENNQKWDCYNQKKLNLIPKDFYKFDPTDGSQTRYYRFNDGSFVKVEAVLENKIRIDGSKKSNALLKRKIKNKTDLNEVLSLKSKNSNNHLSNFGYTLPESTLTTYGYESGSGYSWYWDWRIAKTVGAQSAYFFAEWVNVVDGPDYLIPSGCFSGNVTGFGEVNYKTVIVEREKEDERRHRYALVRQDWTANYAIDTPWGGGSIAGGTFSLWLGVGNDSYYIDDDVPY
ncbi:MAG: hypothetical protein N4A62_06800 [Marinisporobacter sp.]|jgi:hypothetical protein|nr:hypothetical protein [Marinisporobacter sp.]MCV6599661.1 hypothetical protein [Alphaproteobacteria bacterium]